MSDRQAFFSELKFVRLIQQEAILQDIRTTIRDVSSQLGQPRTAVSSKRRCSAVSESSPDDDWPGQQDQGADQAKLSAPVNIIRQKAGTHSGAPTVHDDIQDVVMLGLVSEDQAQNFEQM